MTINSALTCVTCYYPVKNKHGDNYLNWFKNTLVINCPYVIFTEIQHIPMLKSFRGDLPTYFIELNIENFHTYQYATRMITHPVHCPSVELNLIWNEKIFFMDRASELNYFNSEWFKWIDAGICTFRDTAPTAEPLNVDKLHGLPKDKIIYSSSSDYREDYVKPKPNIYYHHISGTYIIHRDIITSCSLIYKEYLNKLLVHQNIWTDQVILTHIYKDVPDLFYKWFDGYGEIAKYLFT